MRRRVVVGGGRPPRRGGEGLFKAKTESMREVLSDDAEGSSRGERKKLSIMMFFHPPERGPLARS